MHFLFFVDSFLSCSLFLSHSLNKVKACLLLLFVLWGSFIDGFMKTSRCLDRLISNRRAALFSITQSLLQAELFSFLLNDCLLFQYRLWFIRLILDSGKCYSLLTVTGLLFRGWPAWDRRFAAQGLIRLSTRHLTANLVIADNFFEIAQISIHRSTSWWFPRRSSRCRGWRDSRRNCTDRLRTLWLHRENRLVLLLLQLDHT